MTLKIPRYDINREPFMTEIPDFNRKSQLLQTERTYKARINAAIQLTSEEKLFQIQILDPKDRDQFSCLPGQFVMVELPGCGEIAISISGSSSNHEFIELCIRKVGKVTNMIHRLEAGAMKCCIQEPAQPNTFSTPANANTVHTIIPIACTDQRNAV